MGRLVTHCVTLKLPSLDFCLLACFCFCFKKYFVLDGGRLQEQRVDMKI